MKVLHVFCDGSITGGAWAKKAERHTTPHGWSGWVVKLPDGTVVNHHSIDLGQADYMSGNIAEYMALRSALRWLRETHQDFNLMVFSDSQLVLRQMTGEYRCYKPQLVILRDACRELATTFPSVSYHWIGRDQNRYADFMSKALQTLGFVPEVPVPPEVIEEWR